MVLIEDKVYEIMRELDVNYVLVIFGGFIGYFFDGKIMEFKILRNFMIKLLVKYKYYVYV